MLQLKVSAGGSEEEKCKRQGILKLERRKLEGWAGRKYSFNLDERMPEEI